MKKILLLFVLCLSAMIINAQFIYKIKADSVLITNDSCNAELNLENGTRHTLGFLANRGNGRTEFRRGLIKINDTLYIIGFDTLNLASALSSLGAYIQNQTAIYQSASYRISGSATIKGGLTSQTLTGLSNERLGYGALIAYNVSGKDNTAIGYNSLNLYNQTDSGNTALGAYSLEKFNTAYNIGQTAVGAYSLQNFVGTYFNTAVGYKALQGASGSTGSENVAFGAVALGVNTTGSGNAAIGNFTLPSNTTGYNNLVVGNNSMYFNTTGFHNSAIGYSVMSLNTTGNYNNAIGSHALDNNSSGGSNMAIGNHSLYSSTTGNNNVAIGSSALYTGSSLNNNTAIGTTAGFNNNGSGNVFIGYQSGYNEPGSNKLYIANSSTANPLILGDFSASNIKINGSMSVTTIPFLANRDTVLTYDPITKQILATKITTGGSSNDWALNGNAGTTASNFLGTTDNVAVRFRTNNTEKAIIDTNGNVGINTSTPAYKLDVNGTARINTLPFLASRDTVLTYNPTTKQVMATKLTLSSPSRVTDVSFHSDATVNIVMTNQVNSEQYLGNSSRNQIWFDGTNYDSVRTVAMVATFSASVNSPRLYVQYSTNGTTWTTIGTGTGTNAVSLATPADLKKSVWIVLPIATKTDIRFRVAQHGGDGVADPQVGKVSIQFK